MKMLVIRHDNGIVGQDGFSDEAIRDESQVKDILTRYEISGITVYAWYVTE